MVTFSVTILGTNAALPDKSSITSAQVVNIREHLYLVDCGEGTQMKLQQFRIKRNKIEAIFISHLHGDHVFGLPGLITSYAHFQRKKPLHIIGPKGIAELVNTNLRLSESHIEFDLNFHELDHSDAASVYEDAMVKVTAFPLKHRIPAYGYRFDEVYKVYNILPEKIKQWGLTRDQILAAKRGEDVRSQDGTMIPNSDLVYYKNKARSYVYCSDTAYDERIVGYISNADVLYHEATYLSDMKLQAQERMHSTVEEAAKIGILAGVGRLVIGHFSGRYTDKSAFLSEGKQWIDNIELGMEGVIVEITPEKKL